MTETKALGFWSADADGLPRFTYTGALPYRAALPDGRPVKLPEDPWFLLGNYRMTLFAHVSGEVEILSGQRAWARLNQGAGKDSGANHAVLAVERGGEGVSLALAGMDSLAADPAVCTRTFGCGRAEYVYRAQGVEVTRALEVRPSTTPYNGASAYRTIVTLRNVGSEPARLHYEEGVTANFVEIKEQGRPEAQRPVRFALEGSAEGELARARMQAVCDDPLCIETRGRLSLHDGYAPELFIRAESGAAVRADGGRLSVVADAQLDAGQSATLSFLTGFAYDGIDAVIGEFEACGKGWADVLPLFADEPDQALRRELTWHAYTLEAMATYSELYGETKIPQGTIYDYDWGAHASARDHFQHGLPLVYYNAPLAKSVLKYMLGRTTPRGEILLMEKGAGYGSHERYFTSDQQLFFFLLMGAYLRETKDYAFLDEEVRCFPPDAGCRMKVIRLIEQCYLFLRDEVGRGEHGLMRLLNSDWNDAVYYIVKAPYNRVLLDGESHMNTAMALVTLREMAQQLRASGRADVQRLCDSMDGYRAQLWQAFAADMGERDFPRRKYFAGKAYGEDNMFLEPQGYLLMSEELPVERKKRLYAQMRRRVYDGEALGAREQERPEFEDAEFDKGSRENGGFWWALNGPVILGVATFDREEAMRLLRNMTLHNLSQHYPQYWSSYWSAADNQESCLIPEAGLPDQSERYADIPVFCAHPHAWVLYCYYCIR